MAVIGASNSWGITVGLNPGSYPVTGQLSQQVVLWAALLGCTRFRFQFSAEWIWRNQNDPSSAWSWAPLDDAIYKLQTMGFYIIYTIRMGNPAVITWVYANTAMQSSTLPWFLPDPASMLIFALAIAARYNGVFNVPGYGPLKIHCLEWENETFNSHHQAPGSVQGIHASPYAEYNAAGVNVTANVEPDRDVYFHWLSIVQGVPTLKAAYPSLVIGMAAIWWMWDVNFADFITGLGPISGGANALAMVSYMNCHLYFKANNPITGGGGHLPSVSTCLTNMRNSCTALGFSAVQMPIHISEFGFQVPSDCDDPTRAVNYANILDYAIGRGDVTEIDFYTLDDGTNNPDQSSLITWSASLGQYVISPAYTVLQQRINAHPIIGRG